jgi:gentisate 1,2-dioxygenase
MDETKAILKDLTGVPLSSGSLDELKPTQSWPPVTVTKEEIDAEIERLASLPRPDNGRRRTQFVHPAADRGDGLNPGVAVSLDVLKPGEETAPIRHNSTQVNFCIAGGGAAIVGGKRITFQQYDVWNHPSFATYRHVNDTGDLQVRLTYSNAPLLEMMRVHLTDENPPADSHVAAVAATPRAGAFSVSKPATPWTRSNTSAHQSGRTRSMRAFSVSKPVTPWTRSNTSTHQSGRTRSMKARLVPSS